MPYTSRDEITTAVQLAVEEKVASGLNDTMHPFVLLILVTVFAR
jgi:hypothetical protein